MGRECVNAAELNLWAMRKTLPQVNHVPACNLGSLICKQVDQVGL